MGSRFHFSKPCPTTPHSQPAEAKRLVPPDQMRVSLTPRSSDVQAASHFRAFRQMGVPRNYSSICRLELTIQLLGCWIFPIQIIVKNKINVNHPVTHRIQSYGRLMRKHFWGILVNVAMIMAYIRILWVITGWFPKSGNPWRNGGLMWIKWDQAPSA